MYDQQLVFMGLTKRQAKIYDVLIREGRKTAGDIAKAATISRPLVYQALDELAALKLVGKEDKPGKVATFSPQHPFVLKDIVAQKRDEAEKAHLAVDSILGKMISDFHLISGQPGIHIYEGFDGIRELYENILFERKPISLFRSYKDKSDPKTTAILREFIALEVKYGIKTRAITPTLKNKAGYSLDEDRNNLTERREIPFSKFKLPAQIVLFGNKVALTSYQDEIITTIIENRAIGASFSVIFELLWEIASLPPYPSSTAILSVKQD